MRMPTNQPPTWGSPRPAWRDGMVALPSAAASVRSPSRVSGARRMDDGVVRRGALKVTATLASMVTRSGSMVPPSRPKGVTMGLVSTVAALWTAASACDASDAKRQTASAAHT